MPYQQPPPDLIINQFQAGVADSPQLGFGDMRNVDPNSEPGILKLAHKLWNMTSPISVQTFTANVSANTITTSGNFSPFSSLPASTSGWFTAFTVSSTGTLPGGLSAGTTYWQTLGSTNSTFQVATSLANAIAGTVVTITSTGTGTHTITPINMATPSAWAYYPGNTGNGTYFILDNSGRVWRWDYQSPANPTFGLITGNTVDSTASGNGMTVYKNYLIVFRNHAIDVYGDLSTSSPSWTNSWQICNQSSTDSFKHCSLVGQDDIVYFGDRDNALIINQPYIGSFFQKPNKVFNPTDSTTYSFTNQALTLPVYKYVNCLAEQGINLLIGTAGKEIYPWDRTSTSFRLPIISPESNITAMINFGNVLYFGAGSRGNIYVNEYGSYVQKVSNIPFYLTQISSTEYAVILQMVTFKSRIYCLLASQNVPGVWSFDPNTKSLVMEHSIGTLQSGDPTVLIPIDYDNLLVGYPTELDSTLAYNQYYPNGYVGYAESPIYRVGTPNSLKQYQNLELALARPLGASQGVQIYYRYNESAAYSLAGTFDYATYGAISQYEIGFPGDSCMNIQIKIALTAAINDQTTPKVLEVRLR